MSSSDTRMGRCPVGSVLIVPRQLGKKPDITTGIYHVGTYANPYRDSGQGRLRGWDTCPFLARRGLAKQQPEFQTVVFLTKLIQG